MVSALDESVRQIVTTLKKKGLYDNSIIIFTTDNGGAAGGLDASAGSNYPLRGAKNTLWEGGVRGVGFVHSPLIKKRGEINCLHPLILISRFQDAVTTFFFLVKYKLLNSKLLIRQSYAGLFVYCNNLLGYFYVHSVLLLNLLSFSVRAFLGPQNLCFCHHWLTGRPFLFLDM